MKILSKHSSKIKHGKKKALQHEFGATLELANLLKGKSIGKRKKKKKEKKNAPQLLLPTIFYVVWNFPFPFYFFPPQKIKIKIINYKLKKLNKAISNKISISLKTTKHNSFTTCINCLGVNSFNQPGEQKPRRTTWTSDIQCRDFMNLKTSTSNPTVYTYMYIYLLMVEMHMLQVTHLSLARNPASTQWEEKHKLWLQINPSSIII